MGEHVSKMEGMLSMFPALSGKGESINQKTA